MTTSDHNVRIINESELIMPIAGAVPLFFTAGIENNGTLWAYGDNNYGQLGAFNRRKAERYIVCVDYDTKILYSVYNYDGFLKKHPDILNGKWFKKNDDFIFQNFVNYLQTHEPGQIYMWKNERWYMFDKTNHLLVEV